MTVSKRVNELPDSNFVNILKMAAEDKNIISLGPGEPDFDTPRHIITAAKKALDMGFTHYSPMAGRQELLEEISKKLRKDNKVNVSPNEIMVSAGSTEALFLAFAATIDAGEQVLTPDPTFLTYQPTVELFNGYPISVPLKQEEGFQLVPEDIEAAIKDAKKVKVLVFCSPSNPTGTVLKKRVLEELADVAVEHNLTVFADEAYEKLVYGSGKHISMASLNGMQDRVVTFQSFSKTYAMPGFRIGYAAGPEKLIKAMVKTHIYTSLSASTISQVAAVTALNGTQKPVEKMRKEYDRRRKLIYNRVKEMNGFEVHEPHGAFYLFPSISFKHKNGKKFTSTQFSEFLIKEAKVLTVPGSEFGRCGDGFMRFSYATEFSKIEQAMDKIEKATLTLQT